MLYEWIDGTSVKLGSNAELDGNLGEGATPTNIGAMLYYNVVEDGSRGNGWYEIDGSENVGTDSDTDWYYIDDGEVKYADGGTKDLATYDEDGAVYVQRMKIEGKYFAFNEKGQMQDGLQYCKDAGGFYYFDENGYQKTGRVSNIECDDDDYNFYFTTTNGKNGQGYKGEKDNYLYFNGKRLEADDDYRLWFYDGDIYLTNNKGKIQTAKSGKKYDIENKGINEEDVTVTTNSSGKVLSVVKEGSFSYTKEDLLNEMAATVVESLTDDSYGKDSRAAFEAYADTVEDDMIVSIPFIQLYDDMYTYWFELDKNGDFDTYTEMWMDINNPGFPAK